MVDKQNHHNVSFIGNQKLPNNECFSQHFNDTLIKTAMIDEMARSDNWQSLDECLEFKPEIIKNFARYADAALRAIRRMQEKHTSLSAN
jgi:hypothetical protein